MCPDLRAAARNRQMVANKRNVIGYQIIEAIVKSYPRNKPLPEQLYGNIPSVGKHENLYGFHEVE